MEDIHAIFTTTYKLLFDLFEKSLLSVLTRSYIFWIDMIGPVFICNKILNFLAYLSILVYLTFIITPQHHSPVFPSQAQRSCDTKIRTH